MVAPASLLLPFALVHAYGPTASWSPTASVAAARLETLRWRSPSPVAVTSPFSSNAAATSSNGPLPLTEDNVEMVLDEMRPYLIADGGNVALREIDGATVVLELQGACGTCVSSSMTMKYGLERGLLEKIPEIIAVEQVMQDGSQLTEEAVEEVLGEIRPFLRMAGGDIEMLSIDAASLQPSVTLHISGSAAEQRSLRSEIILKLREKMPTLAGVLFE